MKNKDQKLLSCLKESDKNSFRELFSKYHQSLFNFVLYRLKDEVIADDIVQETFLRVWNHRNSIKQNQSFFSYIAKISNNLCMDYFRHENVKLRHKEHIPQPTYSDVDNPAMKYESKILESSFVLVTAFFRIICITLSIFIIHNFTLNTEDININQ